MRHCASARKSRERERWKGQDCHSSEMRADKSAQRKSSFDVSWLLSQCRAEPTPAGDCQRARMPRYRGGAHSVYLLAHLYFPSPFSLSLFSLLFFPFFSLLCRGGGPRTGAKTKKRQKKKRKEERGGKGRQRRKECIHPPPLLLLPPPPLRLVSSRQRRASPHSAAAVCCWRCCDSDKR